MKCTTRAAAIKRYGPIDMASRHWANQAKFIKMFKLPFEIPGFYVLDTKHPVQVIACNIDLHEPLKQAFLNVKTRGLLGQLKTFDGCFNIRSVRGSKSVSAHSYGLALDLNAATNGLGKKPTMSKDLVKCFTDEGFDWGGNFSTRKDGMHFSYCWEGKSAQETALHIA